MKWNQWSLWNMFCLVALVTIVDHLALMRLELLDILEYIEGPWLETNGVFFSPFGFLNQNWQAKCFLFSFY